MEASSFSMEKKSILIMKGKAINSWKVVKKTIHNF